MDLKGKILKLIKRGYQEEQALIAGLSEEERSLIGTLDEWSVKDAIAHTATWKGRMAHNLLAVSQGKAPTQVDDYDRENEVIFERFREQPWEQVLALAEDSYRSLADQVGAIEEGELGSQTVLPWQEGRALWELVVGNGYTHVILHLAECHRNRGDTRRADEVSEAMARSSSELDASPRWQGIVRFNLACHYSLSGEKSKAIRELREALKLNPELIKWSKKDPDFEPIREDPEFQSVYEEG